MKVAILCLLLFSAHVFGSNKIVNGSRVFRGDPLAESLVGITFDNMDVCTGTLVARNLILTAAHCILDRFGNVRNFDNAYAYFGLDWQDKDTLFLKVTSYYYAAYNTGPYDRNDIALLFFQGNIPPRYRPAKILRTEYYRSIKHTLGSGKFHVLGYGIRNVNPDRDGGRLQKGMMNFYAFRGHTEIVMDKGYDGASTCRGDSGGPLFMELNNEIALLGVTSRGATNCDNTGTFTAVPDFLTFLDEAKTWLYNFQGVGHHGNYVFYPY